MSSRAAIYTRISRDKTGAGLGVARQEKECRELAERLSLAVAEVYSDNDLSGRSTKGRVNYLRMLADVKANRVDAIICWHPDRLTRKTSDLEEYIRATESIPTYTVAAGHFDLTTPAGRATAKTIGAWAQAEIETKAERQKAKNRQLAQGGQRIGRGGPVPFGYADDRVTAHSVNGPLVRQAYADVLAGKGLGGIAVDWQVAGAAVPQAKSGRWDRASVKKVLLRESNAGLVVLQGKVLPGVVGEWGPLIGVSDFYAVKALLTDPARRLSPGSEPKHLLTGIVRCDSCKHPMRRQKVNRAGAGDSVYACSNSAARAGDCPQPTTISMQRLDEWFVDKLLEERAWHSGITVTQSSATDAAEAKGVTLAELDERIRGIALQMAETDADMASLVEALTAAKIDRAQAESAEIVTTEQHALPLHTSWTYLSLSQDAEAVAHKKALIRSHLAEGGLCVKPVGRGNWRAPLPDRIIVRWAD